jgi:hypothetical protein
MYKMTDSTLYVNMFKGLAEKLRKQASYERQTPSYTGSPSYYRNLAVADALETTADCIDLTLQDLEPIATPIKLNLEKPESD